MNSKPKVRCVSGAVAQSQLAIFPTEHETRRGGTLVKTDDQRFVPSSFDTKLLPSNEPFLHATSRTFDRLHVKRSLPKLSAVYPVLWRFAVERQMIYLKRVAGHPRPWTTDRILETFKFTNPYRATDRVSQQLIRISYGGSVQHDADTILLQTLLFKIFNKAETWDAIVSVLGPPNARDFSFEKCSQILSGMKAKGKSIYSGAYIMPSGSSKGGLKHQMHLSLLAGMLKDRLASRISETKSLQQVYQALLSYPTLGPFLAFQYAIDINYTTLTDHSESEFVVAGPGALDGLSKCFASLGDYTPEDTIKWLTEQQDREFARLELRFPGLWGRPLQPIDVQNLFCEVSKYTRESHPKVEGRAGRTRIKQRFTPSGQIPTPLFPPKWGINQNVRNWLAHPLTTEPLTTPPY